MTKLQLPTASTTMFQKLSTMDISVCMGFQQKILELDVAADKAKGMKPAELKSTRPVYDGFGTKQWAKAVHNENSKHVEEKF